ncbi:MAG: cysteine desulfurase family protein [Patescibacteria group bacterium]
MNKHKRIFLDYASCTPVAPEVVSAMKPFLEGNFANPSALYAEAMVAKDAVLDARTRIAGVLNCQKTEIVFTASGTESNNLALLGAFQAHRRPDFVPHIVTTTIEHPAILEVCEEIKVSGGEVTIVPVSEDGVVSVIDIKNAIQENTVLVSVMYANNEIGTVQPIREIGKMIRDVRQKNNSSLPYFHTDACQAGLYLSLDTLKLGVDMMTLDGIKMYGPRGMAMLYVRNGIELHPLMHGGGQERGLRSGTENVPGIVGLAKAIEIADEMRESESARLIHIRDYAISEILKTFPNATLNGSGTERLPNNINICFPGLDAEFAVISLDVAQISTSYSSSCRTLSENSSSYVISALNKKNCSESSLRFTMGRETTRENINELIVALQKIVR